MVTIMNSGKWTKPIFIFGVAIIILSTMAMTTVISGLTKESVLANIQLPAAPDGWFLSGSQPADYKTGIDSVFFQHGKKSAYIESAVENPDGFSTLMQQINVKEFKGKRIKMTGFIKTKDLNQGAMMWVRVDDFGNKIVADFDNMQDRPVAANSDWTKCEIVFDVPDSKCSISFGFILSGIGKIWVDNLSFEIVDSTVEKTAHPINQDMPDEMLNRFPDAIPEKAPSNLDFEN